MNDRRKKGLEKEIARVIGTLLLTEVKSDKLRNNVSVHHVEMTKDGRYVDITFSILDLNNTMNKDKIFEELTKLKGFFRRTLGSALSIRYVPEVRIHLDDTIEYGVKISAILNDIKSKDSE